MDKKGCSVGELEAVQGEIVLLCVTSDRGLEALTEAPHSRPARPRSARSR